MQPSFCLFSFGMMQIAAAGASAAAPAIAPANAVAKVTECRNIASDAARLSCYDQAVAALDNAVSHHDLTVIDKEDVHRARRSLFGLTMPNLTVFGMGNKQEEAYAPDLVMLDTTVRAVRPVSYGKWDMETEEHAVWRNVDLLDFAPTVGEKMHMKKGVLGSYFLKLGSDRAIKAERIR